MATNVPPGGQGNPGQQVQGLNPALKQQLNLESVRIRAHDLSAAIVRILDNFKAAASTNSTPKWQEVLSQFAMVNLELINIVEDVKKVSKAFVVHPKNVNAENSTILPVMLSSKLLPEMEQEEASKKEQILSTLSKFPVQTQVEKLKSRIEMIAAACTSIENVMADARKSYGLGSRQSTAISTSAQNKNVEEEKLLRAAVIYGEGLRLPGDQRQLPTILPPHLIPALASGDNELNFSESASGALYQRNPSLLSTSNVVANPGASQQASSSQLIGRSVASPMAMAGGPSIDSASASPLQYANSPRSGTAIMNALSPQQQQSQRQKLQQTTQHPQQYLTQQQFRQSPTPSTAQQHSSSQDPLQQRQNFSLHAPQNSPRIVSTATAPQNPIPISPELQGQLPHKFPQDRQHYSSYANRSGLSGQALHHGLASTPNPLNPGSQIRAHMNPLTSSVPLFGGTNPLNPASHTISGLTAQQNFSRQQEVLEAVVISFDHKFVPYLGYLVGHLHAIFLHKWLKQYIIQDHLEDLKVQQIWFHYHSKAVSQTSPAFRTHILVGSQISPAFLAHNSVGSQISAVFRTLLRTQITFSRGNPLHNKTIC